MFAGYSKSSRKHRRKSRASKRAGFGFTASEHMRRAQSGVSVARVEAKVVRQHLARGECAAAVRGLAMTGWALGKLSGDRAGARTTGRKRDAAPRLTARTSHDLRKLADKIITVCKVPHGFGSRRR